jgi:aspartyl aminopeptidase
LRRLREQLQPFVLPFTGRLDNLASSYCALRALLDTVADDEWLAQEKSVQMVALFDNEEVSQKRGVTNAAVLANMFSR